MKVNTAHPSTSYHPYTNGSSGYSNPDCPNHGGAREELASVSGSSWPAHNSPASSHQTIMESNSHTASPGPIRKFRETYGSDSSVNLPAAKRCTTQYMESWLQSHQPHQYPLYSSNPGSVMSNMTAMSALSALSVDTNTDYMEASVGFPDLIAGAESSTQKTQSVATASQFFQSVDSYLIAVISKLCSSNEEEKGEGLQLMYRVGKSQLLNYCYDASKLQPIVGHLFCEMIKGSPTEIHRALRLLYELSHYSVTLEAIRREFIQTRGGVVHILCSLLNPEEGYCKYSTSILHTLFEQPNFGFQYRRCARSESVIIRLMNIIRAPECTYKHIALENIRVAIGNRKEWKRLFAREKGVKLCLDLMEEYAEEKILFRIANLLLTCILTSEEDDKSIVNHLVQIGGIETLSKYLDHGSPRLLRTVARCLASVSDSDAIPSRALDEALARSIQMLGSTDMELVSSISGFLCNVQSKSPRGKVYIHDNKGIENLMRLLCVWSSTTGPSKPEGDKLNELLDTVLTALGNLTANYPPDGANYYVESACRQILYSNYGGVGSPRLFLNMLSSGRKHLVMRILLIVLRIVENVPGAMTSFIDVYDDRQRMNYVYHIHTLLFASVEGYAALSRVSRSKLDVEALRRPREEIRRLLTFLHHLTAENLSLRQIVALSSAYRNPILPMPMLNDKDLEICLIRLLLRLAIDTECIEAWRVDATAVRIIEQCAYSTEEVLAGPARQILEALRRQRDYQLKFSAMQIDG